MAVFVDSNVLVYARDASEPKKQPRAVAWLEYLWRSREGRLSFQVLQEYYVTVTVKLKPGLPAESARRDVRALLVWEPVRTDGPIIENAWALQDQFSLSWWDALVVSAAQTLGCNEFLSEDLQDGQTFGSLRVVDPFAHAPPALPK